MIEIEVVDFLEWLEEEEWFYDEFIDNSDNYFLAGD